MKNTKLLLLGLLTPLLCGVSFGFNPLSNYDNTPNNVRNSVGSLTYNIYVGKLYCVYVEDPTGQNTYSLRSRDTVSWGCNNNQFTLMGRDGFYCFEACDNQSNFSFIGEYNNSNLSYRLYEFDTPLSVGQGCSQGESCYDDDQIGELIQQNNECGYAYDSLSGDYNTCLNSLNVEQGLLATCQSDLSSCQNGCDTLVNQCLLDKSNIQSSYSGCLETNSSLQNYNDSLSDQLNQCLMSGSGSAGSGDFTIYEYQLSWFDGFTNLHLPITNSLNLPYGYRGYLNDGVLSIKNLENNDLKLNIGDNDFKENVVSNYGVIYLFLMSSGLFLIMLYAIRRYFIGLKSIK